MAATITKQREVPLGLVEVLDWTAVALDRVDRPAFFARFNEGEAVPYFYEPFLQAFDPDLRKQLGVWYTPAEVVRYMVARVNRALKDDLGIPDGFAAENVYVLDPCCGTGAYLAEVLSRIAANLEGQGLGALAGARAATYVSVGSFRSRGFLDETPPRLLPVLLLSRAARTGSRDHEREIGIIYSTDLYWSVTFVYDSPLFWGSQFRSAVSHHRASQPLPRLPAIVHEGE